MQSKKDENRSKLKPLAPFGIDLGTKNNAKHLKVFGLVVVCVAAFLLLVAISPLGQNIQFYSKWSQCGQKPVSTLGPGFNPAHASHYFESPTFSVIRQSIDFYCTPRDAELHGYSANENQYDFPHLKPNEEPTQWRHTERPYQNDSRR